MRILIIEDEARLAMTLADIITYAGYNVDVSMDGEEGLQFALSGIYDAIILDVMLPKLNGFKVLTQLRSKQIATPVLMLTARSELTDRIQGLDSGADYYLTKPFENAELLACLRAVLRRQGEITPLSMDFGDLTLTPSICELRCKTNAVSLSAKELDMMQILMVNNSQYLSKEMLLLKIWGYECVVNENNVEAYISFLRKKLQLLESCVHIIVARKIGYRLEAKQS